MAGKVGRNAPCLCGSGRKAKHCCGVSKPSVTLRPLVDYAEDPEVRQVFLHEGQVPLTHELIAELVARGWPEDDLLAAREAGAVYSTIRDSLIYPLQVEGDISSLNSDEFRELWERLRGES
jgi:hypothetical protein